METQLSSAQEFGYMNPLMVNMTPKAVQVRIASSFFRSTTSVSREFHENSLNVSNKQFGRFLINNLDGSL